MISWSGAVVTAVRLTPVVIQIDKLCVFEELPDDYRNFRLNGECINYKMMALPMTIQEIDNN